MEDMDSLNVKRPDFLTRDSSEYIPEVIDYIKQIIQNGFAYEALDQFTLTRVPSLMQDKTTENLNLAQSAINRLSQRVREHSQLQTRDFVLWKKSKNGEPTCESPWRPGRPGWHIECSAMVSNVLGPIIDIHAGGVDLRFPHHSNEVAQAEAYQSSHNYDADDAPVVLSPGNAVIDLVNHPSDGGPVGYSVATSAEPPTSVTPNSQHAPTGARPPVAANAGSSTTVAATPVTAQVEAAAQPSAITAADESRQTTSQPQSAFPPKTQLQTAGQDIPTQVVAPQSYAPIASSIPVPHKVSSQQPLSLRLHLQIPSPSPVPQLPQKRLGQEPPNAHQIRTGPNLPPFSRSTPNIPQTASGLSPSQLRAPSRTHPSLWHQPITGGTQG
ncbi:unnamed protein product [Chondrus crispus]|uniref:tRNA synthetases class I catalytic domain-containing protein n=1 Tax=Chondrus crispus TaxID=2769 RepID=R7QIY8_CHOCR|nr:unnamed protein product [Chondrus crispus]CDF37436.1 unnamed protein product [Chondrus crispus]|eukprot:XP_005717255.1 unnamed protein product [Chondrus crispus]